MCILLHISTVYHVLHSIIEVKKNVYFAEIPNYMLQHFTHSQHNLYAFHTPYIHTAPVQFEFENLR
jgi:hypothetical protein